MSTSTPPNPLAAFRADIADMTVAELRQQFPGEFNTHRRILADAKAGRCVIHEGFLAFRNFLGHVGPQGERSRTLDRIDNADPEYGPGKVRWATPREQANNRRTTIKLRGPDGTVRPVSEWAIVYRQKPDTIRNRLDLGWPEEEAVTGVRRSQAVSASGPDGPERRAEDAYPEAPLSPLTGLGDVFGIRDEASGPWPEGMDGHKYERAYRALADQYPNCTPPRGFTRRAFSSWVLTLHQRRCRQAIVAAIPSYDDPEADPPSEDTLLRLPAYRGMMQARRIYLDNGLGCLPLPERKEAETLIRHASADFLRPAMLALGWIKEPTKAARRPSSSAAAAD